MRDIKSCLTDDEITDIILAEMKLIIDHCNDDDREDSADDKKLKKAAKRIRDFYKYY